MEQTQTILHASIVSVDRALHGVYTGLHRRKPPDVTAPQTVVASPVIVAQPLLQWSQNGFDVKQLKPGNPGHVPGRQFSHCARASAAEVATKHNGPRAHHRRAMLKVRRSEGVRIMGWISVVTGLGVAVRNAAPQPVLSTSRTAHRCGTRIARLSKGPTVRGRQPCVSD